MTKKKETLYNKLDKNIFDKKTKEDTLNDLLRKPQKIKSYEQPKYYESKPNLKHQIDTVRLPNDSGFNHAIVITDMATRKTDAQPVKSTKSKNTLEATKKIYSRNILKKPNEIISDQGAEFKGDFQSELLKENIKITKKPKGRHLGIVDRKIQQLVDGINYLQSKEELKNKKASKKWIKNLPIVVNAINETTDENFKIKTTNKIPQPKIKNGQEIYIVGDKVRTLLFYPIDKVTNKALYGKFRTGDIRWSKDIHTITNVLVQPNKPLMYIVDNDEKNPYHHKQLQRIKPSQKKITDFIN